MSSEEKKLAAIKAVQHIENNMVVGLGTGSTVFFALGKLAERINNEGLKVTCVATSKQTEDIAGSLGIEIQDLNLVDTIDLTIDGADEIDHDLNMIKGGGGALLREKIIAKASKKVIAIVDSSKNVAILGKFALPVEITPFGWRHTRKQVESLGCISTLRQHEGSDFITDNNNLILDCQFNKIENAVKLESQINSIVGVLENGLFTNIANTKIVGIDKTTTTTERS